MEWGGVSPKCPEMNHIPQMSELNQFVPRLVPIPSDTEMALKGA